jgi:hypothetical protein
VVSAEYAVALTATNTITCIILDKGIQPAAKGKAFVQQIDPSFITPACSPPWRDGERPRTCCDGVGEFNYSSALYLIDMDF